MILTREIIVKINESNFSYYEELGYDVAIGEALIIPIELLSAGSRYKIDCKCDKCGIVKEVIFRNYVKTCCCFYTRWRIQTFNIANTRC
jgi:anaerobic C4-dicarboxylate transporter